MADSRGEFKLSGKRTRNHWRIAYNVNARNTYYNIWQIKGREWSLIGPVFREHNFGIFDDRKRHYAIWVAPNFYSLFE